MFSLLSIVSRYAKCLLVPVLAAALLGLHPRPVSAATRLVLPDGSGPYPTIQAAIDAAEEGDEILLGDGVFVGPGNRDLSIPEFLAFSSESGRFEACVIDLEGFGLGEVDVAVTCRDVTVRNGGGLFIFFGEVSFSGCRFQRQSLVVMTGSDMAAAHFTDCTFEDGSGIQLLTSNLTATGCTFSGCTSPVLRGWATALQSCVFWGNRGTGPLLVGHDYMGMAPYYDMDGCQFLDNDVPVVIEAPVDATDCTFARNAGTAVLVENTSLSEVVTPAFTRTTFAGNGGPAVALSQNEWQGAVEAFIDHVIIASGSGPAVSCFGAGVSAHIACCDIWSNAGGDWVGCIAGQEGQDGNFSADPLFCGTGLSPYMLRQDSPCQGGPCGQVGAWRVGCGASAVESAFGATAALVARPNPTRESLQITFAAGAEVSGGRLGNHDGERLTIHDASGRRVRVLSSSGGLWRWDRRDEGGHLVAGGVYLLRTETAGEPMARTVVVLD